MTQPKVGFDATTLSFGSSAVGGALILIVALSWYWPCVEPFDPTLFGVGLAASILDTIGKAFIQRAFAAGPAGIVGAFVEINNIVLILIETVRERRVPSGLEWGSFVLATVGALWFVIPNELFWLINKAFCCGNQVLAEPVGTNIKADEKSVKVELENNRLNELQTT